MSESVGLLEPEQLSELVAEWEVADRPFAATLRSGVPQAQALARLGVRLCLQERYNEAVAVLRAAITLAPRNPLFWNNLAVVQERAEQPAEAIKTLEHSLSLSRMQADAWLLLANLKKKCNDLTGAAAAFEEAIALEPGSPIAWQGLGLIKQEQREYPRAIECFLTCARCGGATPPIVSILGQLYYQTGQFEKSRDAYAAAVELDGENAVSSQMLRKMQFVCEVLGSEPVERALENYERAAGVVPSREEISELVGTAFSLLSGYGHTEAAKRVGKKRLEMHPASATASYLLKALEGDATLERSPDEYLVEYFDSFAEGFDRQLVNQLGYDIPRELCELAGSFIGRGERLDVLDIGCGTGLCGPLVSGWSKTLTGVDLSPKMLQVAARRRVYDRLVQQEATALLKESAGSADVVLATDVLIYFGELERLFEAVAGSLRVGGVFAFSIERSDQRAYRLLPSGRFAHAVEYVRTVAARHFSEVAARSTTVRLEAAHPVSGDLFVFRRR